MAVPLTVHVCDPLPNPNEKRTPRPSPFLWVSVSWTSKSNGLSDWTPEPPCGTLMLIRSIRDSAEAILGPTSRRA
ncbi:MAG TPA: hypothetical protein VLX56_08265 [Nitrososphaerales archaeon]|nr:hypothetical protein [Nitrososphaerales archaeon]